MCKEKCLKELVCGHSCNQECSSECNCEEKYDKLCLHKKNEENCYEINQICSEICNRECKHSHCKNKCSEPCNVKVCNKRCENKMKCGHQCYGLCGEICPDICKICHQNNNNNIMIKEEKEELYYNTLCGHVFPLKEIEFLFNKKNIEVFKCPECKNPLLLEMRYKEKIRKFLINIKIIKKESYDKNNGINNNYYSNEINKMIDNLMNQYNKEKMNIFEKVSKYYINYSRANLKEKISIIYNLIQNFNEQNIKNNFSLYNLLTLAEKFMGIEYYINLINKQEILEENDFDFLKNFNEIKQYFEPKTIQFNQFFFKELKMKIDNMLYYSILRLTKNDDIDPGFFISLFCPKKITAKDIAKSYFSLDLNLRDLYLNNLDDDKKIIFKSLHSKWYKCSNGHFYVSDEVGKYDDVLKCPHCTFGERAFSLVKNICGF